MKRKIYIARSIASNTFNDAIIESTPQDTVAKLSQIYIAKEIDRGKYIHNGHWIIRSVKKDGELSEYRLPDNLQTADILKMVHKKIKSSDALVAILSSKSYGAIVELGYAVGLGNVAVYVLPEKELTDSEIQDLWLSFHFASLTYNLWEEEDISAIPEFNELGILSIEDYKKYISSIVPNFLKK